MKTIGMGLVGPGFIAAQHIDAVRRLGGVDVIAIAGSSAASAGRRAVELRVARAYGDFHALLEDPDVHVVHNTTPNNLHFEVTRAALAAGKHVISDKPLAMTLEQSRELSILGSNSGFAHVVTFNYRGNPMVQQARALIAQHALGPLKFIQGHYYQDWMSDPNVYSWRSDPSKGGESSALGDIGSHWCDLAEHVTGARIVAVLADLTTVVPLRFSADAPAAAFSDATAAARHPVPVTGEDLASVLLRFTDGARGCFSVGQVLPGHGNDLQLEVNGSLESLRWRQEQQNELWMGSYRKPNTLLDKNPALLDAAARRFARLPAGHQEGWADAFRNLIADAYDWIRRGAAPDDKPQTLPTFEDGYRNHCIIDAMLRSHAAGGVWTMVDTV